HLLRLLDEIERLGRCQQLARDAARIADRLRRKGKPALAGQDLLVRLVHLFCRPRLWRRNLDVCRVPRDPSPTAPIAMVWIGRGLRYWCGGHSGRRVERMDP